VCLAISSTPALAREQKFIIPPIDFVKAAIESGNYKAARIVLDELLKTSPRAVEPNFYMGVLEHHDGNLREAVERFRSILEDNPWSNPCSA
jgi:lipopolysaccharide biosynthesis regulator YciM